MIDDDVKRLAQEYQSAQPFPHAVIDGYFTGAQAFYLEEALDDYPPLSEQQWWKYDNFLEKKSAYNDVAALPFSIVSVIDHFHRAPFLTWLERLTGIDGLIPDPHLNGGGLHQIERGGKLAIHADYNYHPQTKLDRRLNVILYLNKNWDPSWGGQLEFWDQDMTKCVQSIDPFYNRLVVFSTTDTSYHGHPDPLDCPEDKTRKSLALYFYSHGRPIEEQSAPHSTIFKKRPQDLETQAQAEFRKKRSQGRL